MSRARPRAVLCPHRRAPSTGASPEGSFGGRISYGPDDEAFPPPPALRPGWAFSGSSCPQSGWLTPALPCGSLRRSRPSCRPRRSSRGTLRTGRAQEEVQPPRSPGGVMEAAMEPSLGPRGPAAAAVRAHVSRASGSCHGPSRRARTTAQRGLGRGTGTLTFTTLTSTPACLPSGASGLPWPPRETGSGLGCCHLFC